MEGGDCLKNGAFEGIMKGETLAKFLLCIFLYFSATRGRSVMGMEPTWTCT